MTNFVESVYELMQMKFCLFLFCLFLFCLVLFCLFLVCLFLFCLFLFCLFLVVWMYIGLIGGLLFILFQLVFIIDFAHSWNESW